MTVTSSRISWRSGFDIRGAGWHGMLSVEQMMLLLADSRIIPADQLREFEDRLCRDRTVRTVETVAQELVQAGLLTEFQAAEVVRGKAGFLVFGQYLLLEQIGRGGMGEVFRARHTLMNRDVAIKLLRPPILDRVESIQRFKREVRATARLTHPNIVTSHDAGELHGFYYLVMEYIRGTDLSKLVRRSGPLDVPRSIEVAIQIAEGLAHAHSQGIIHRDIKPSNLMLADDGTVKILDLGLSRFREQLASEGAAPGNDDSLTQTGQIMGTIDFMAPEQASDPHKVDQRADIYSLGCTLYFLLSGKLVYQRDSTSTRLMAHRDEAVPSLRHGNPNVPPRLDALLQRMLAKRVEDRIATMQDVVRELRACQQEIHHPELAHGETVVERPAATPKRRRVGAWVWGTAAVVLLVGAVSLAAWMSTAEPTRPAVLKAPVDLLQHVNLPQDALSGEGWARNDSGLLTGSGQPAVLQLNHPAPEDYAIQLTATRRAGEGPLVLGLVVGKTQCFVLLDAHRGARFLTALGNNEQDRLAVMTRSDEQWLEPDQPVPIRCTVRSGTPARIQVRISQQDVIEWRGNSDELRLGFGWAVPRTDRLFLGTNNDSTFLISQLTLEPATRVRE